ncbi:phage coat protein [Sansalvadorimonas verongulae]|uniref:phage coat protein n=1 Tax=Sansalvadorimonas verongulae TaxID=2172824 RepID=UPI0012BBCD7C|nr:phage coat protein [Sansalvadorimonas verongulae]MTI13248.1 phage coat protein [Sansalvadorimonas verongulae]
MATTATRLSDVIKPERWNEYTTEDSTVKQAIWNSGVMVSNELMNTAAAGGGDTYSIPYWKDLPDGEPNYSNDDPADMATPDKIGAGKQVVRTAQLNNAWSAMDLAAELAGSDPIARIRSRIADWWIRQLQSRLVATIKGVYNANAANDNGDMAFITDTPFDATAAIEGASTMGDRSDEFTAILVHSAVRKKMQLNDLIQYIPDSSGGVIGVFRGMAVITDDGMPVIKENGKKDRYVSCLLGGGSIGYGNGNPRVSEEVDRIPLAGKGGGQEILVSRRSVVIHPLGFNWKGTTESDVSPTLADLELATNWERKYNRRHVPLAFVVAPIEADTH